MLPKLNDPFSLVELPRIADVPVEKRVVLPHSQKGLTFQETDVIHLGMSKLIISSYVLKPTPKLVWSFPLSSSTIVDCMDVKDDWYVVGLSERRKQYVKIVKRCGTEVSITAEFPLEVAAVGVMFGTDSSIYVLLRDGSVSHLEYTEMKTESGSENITLAVASTLPSLPPLPRSSTHTVVYHTFMSEHTFQHKNPLLFYISRLNELSSYTCRLIGIDGSKTFEIYNVTFKSHSFHNCLFAISAGVLYTFNKSSKEVSSASLMKPQSTLKSISLEPLFANDDAQEYGFFSPAPERLLLSNQSKLYLVNYKFSSLLDLFQHNTNIKLYLNFALPTKGDSEITSSTYALYLGFNEKRKTSKINYIQVELGKNTLRECLGKSLKTQEEKEKPLKAFPSLLTQNLMRDNSIGAKELNVFLNKLKEAKSDTANFNKAIIEFFKGQGHDDTKSYTHAITDRVVDAALIEQILSLIFTVDSKDSTVQILQDDFLPETAVEYLLSHPLFTSKYANGLLLLLSQLNEPNLLKTAIEKCSALSIDDLASELNNLTELADELDKDPESAKLTQLVFMFLRATIDRLVSNFSLQQITKKLLEILTAEYDEYSKKLERMLGVFINLNTKNSWDLVQAVIDAGGLFNWSIPVIEKLSQVIASKVDALGANSYNLTLTNQALQVEGTKKQNKKKTANKAVVVDSIHEIGTQREELDALLTMANGTTNLKLRVNEGIELAKRIPAYSREKLVL
uniref:U3 small nucleolar RNA-associated protein 8 n=1 Tax=Candidozyma auris TaxID=498019 RepID=A0A0L0NUZ8_CANAR